MSWRSWSMIADSQDEMRISCRVSRPARFQPELLSDRRFRRIRRVGSPQRVVTGEPVRAAIASVDPGPEDVHDQTCREPLVRISLGQSLVIGSSGIFNQPGWRDLLDLRIAGYAAGWPALFLGLALISRRSPTQAMGFGIVRFADWRRRQRTTAFLNIEP